MSVKYSRLPTADPDSVSIDFNSIYKYGDNKDFSTAFDYGEKLGKNQYKSMFTYSGGYDPHKKIELVGKTINLWSFFLTLYDSYFCCSSEHFCIYNIYKIIDNRLNSYSRRYRAHLYLQSVRKNCHSTMLYNFCTHISRLGVVLLKGRHKLNTPVCTIFY